MNHLKPWAALWAAIALCLISCGRSQRVKERLQAVRPVIAVSIEPQRALMEAIVGDSATVITVMPPGANPETFELPMSRRVALADADAYVPVGLLPFEETLQRQLAKDHPGIVIDPSSVGIDLLYGTHDHCEAEGHHSHNEGSAPDPHIWTSVRNARLMAGNMLRTALSVDSANGAYYTARHDALVAHLDSLDAEIASKVSTGPRSFVVWHPSLSYFARDYGLRQVAMGQESKEPTPTGVKQSLSAAKDAGARVFFFQNDYDSRQARGLNEALGTRLMVINPMDYDWERQLIRVADALSADEPAR